jgi:hypothetical protein
LTTPDGRVQFDASYSTLMGWNGWITYQAPAGVLVGSQGVSEMTGSRLTGRYVLGDEFGEYAGDAAFVIDFTAAGPEVATEQVIQDGNSRTVLKIAQQPMLASGMITMPDGRVFSFADLRPTACSRTSGPPIRRQRSWTARRRSSTPAGCWATRSSFSGSTSPSWRGMLSCT